MFLPFQDSECAEKPSPQLARGTSLDSNTEASHLHLSPLLSAAPSPRGRRQPLPLTRSPVPGIPLEEGQLQVLCQGSPGCRHFKKRNVTKGTPRRRCPRISDHVRYLHPRTESFSSTPCTQVGLRKSFASRAPCPRYHARPFISGAYVIQATPQSQGAHDLWSTCHPSENQDLKGDITKKSTRVHKRVSSRCSRHRHTCLGSTAKASVSS